MSHALEAHLLRDQFPDIQLPPFLQRLIDDAYARGFARGFAQGKAHSLLRLLQLRGVALSVEQQALIESCESLPQLNAWFDRAVTATSASDLFD